MEQRELELCFSFSVNKYFIRSGKFVARSNGRIYFSDLEELANSLEYKSIFWEKPLSEHKFEVRDVFTFSNYREKFVEYFI